MTTRVTWLVWNGGVGNPGDWSCLRCGRSGSLPVGCSLTTLGEFVGLLEKEHARCREGFTCPDCGRVSFNPNDLVHRYCGACHRFVDDPKPPAEGGSGQAT